MSGLERCFATVNKAKNYVASVFLMALFCQNKKYHYVDCNGTLNPVALFLKNMFSPSRFYAKVRYGQVPGVPKFLSKGTPIGTPRDNSADFTDAGQLEIKCLVEPNTIPAPDLSELDDLQAKAIAGLFPKDEPAVVLATATTG